MKFGGNTDNMRFYFNKTTRVHTIIEKGINYPSWFTGHLHEYRKLFNKNPFAESAKRYGENLIILSAAEYGILKTIFPRFGQSTLTS